MDSEVINELRKKVQPAVAQLIALASERGLSSLEIRQDDLRIVVERPPVTVPAPRVEGYEPGEHTATEEEHYRLTPVLSTLVGIFRTRPTPEKPPTSQIGINVEQGQVLGYIESMRLTYEIHAPSSGRLAEILVEEGNPVEYGQPLMVLEASE